MKCRDEQEGGQAPINCDALFVSNCCGEVSDGRDREEGPQIAEEGQGDSAFSTLSSV